MLDHCDWSEYFSGAVTLTCGPSGTPANATDLPGCSFGRQIRALRLLAQSPSLQTLKPERATLTVGYNRSESFIYSTQQPTRSKLAAHFRNRSGPCLLVSSCHHVPRAPQRGDLCSRALHWPWRRSLGAAATAAAATVLPAIPEQLWAQHNHGKGDAHRRNRNLRTDYGERELGRSVAQGSACRV